MDAEGDFVRIVAGHWYDAWYAGTQEVMKLQGVEAKAKADVVIGSSGGYPMDINLYQGMKSYAPHKWQCSQMVFLSLFWIVLIFMNRLLFLIAFGLMMN